VVDRGADIFAFLTACRDQATDVLVRAVQDRRVRDDDDGVRTQLGPAIRARPAQATAPLTARPGHPERETTVAVSWTTLTLLPPARLVGHRAR